MPDSKPFSELSGIVIASGFVSFRGDNGLVASKSVRGEPGLGEPPFPGDARRAGMVSNFFEVFGESELDGTPGRKRARG